MPREHPSFVDPLVFLILLFFSSLLPVWQIADATAPPSASDTFYMAMYTSNTTLKLYDVSCCLLLAQLAHLEDVSPGKPWHRCFLWANTTHSSFCQHISRFSGATCAPANQALHPFKVDKLLPARQWKNNLQFPWITGFQRCNSQHQVVFGSRLDGRSTQPPPMGNRPMV